MSALEERFAWKDAAAWRRASLQAATLHAGEEAERQAARAGGGEGRSGGGRVQGGGGGGGLLLLPNGMVVPALPPGTISR